MPTGCFAFSTPVAYGGSYSVTVGTQPVGETCTVSNGSGAGVTAAVSNVSVTCSTNTYTIGGTVTGLGSAAQVTLLNNGSDPKTVVANGAFGFATPVAHGSSYAVTVGTQPIGQTCTVSNGSGAGVAANVSGVSATCANNPLYVYVPVHDAARVQGYRVDPITGTRTSIPGSPFAAGAQRHWIALHPAGTFAYVTNRNDNTVSAYSIDRATGALTPVGGSPFAAGASPNAIALNAAGTFAYVVNANGNDVSAYSIDPATGALAAVPGSPFAAGVVPIKVVVNAAGTYAYVANQNSGDVWAYSIDPVTGALAFKGLAGTGGSPYGITVNAAGTVVYATNWEANVAAFSVDAGNGCPHSCRRQSLHRGVQRLGLAIRCHPSRGNASLCGDGQRRAASGLRHRPHLGRPDAGPNAHVRHRRVQRRHVQRNGDACLPIECLGCHHLDHARQCRHGAAHRDSEWPVRRRYAAGQHRGDAALIRAETRGPRGVPSYRRSGVRSLKPARMLAVPPSFA